MRQKQLERLEQASLLVSLAQDVVKTVDTQRELESGDLIQANLAAALVKVRAEAYKLRREIQQAQVVAVATGG